MSFVYIYLLLFWVLWILSTLLRSFFRLEIRTSESTKGSSLLPTTCPVPEAIQSDYVRGNYEEDKHVGFYYELAFKDITQPRGCKCITSNKTLVSATTLHDDFKVECNGQVYHSDLSFDLNTDLNRKGTMIGRWNNFSLARGVTFPNTIVDVGWDDRGESILQYDWVIEFQCKDKKVLGYEWIEYYGLNFYSQTIVDHETILGEMIKVAVNRGLAIFLQSGLELHRVDHNDCLQDL